ARRRIWRRSREPLAAALARGAVAVASALRMSLRPLAAFSFATSCTAAALAAPQDPPGPVPDVLLNTCDWRLVGPFRGGRVGAVTGVVGERDTLWFGGTGGGVWKTIV